MNRELVWPHIGGLMLAGLSAGIAFGSHDDRNDKTFEYAIGLWGDLPYSDVQALTGAPNLIADMNDSDIEFSVHDGDLKAGNGTPGSVTPTTCSDALYVQAINYFDSLNKPAMFTTGDNDWTDCDRPSNGGFSSRERLDHERQVFFSTPFFTRRASVAAGGSVHSRLPRRQWPDSVCRKSTLDVQGSHLRNLERSGIL